MIFIGVKRNAERYMFCPPRPWMLSGLESGNTGSPSGTHSPTLTFWSLSRKEHFWAQKCPFGSFFAFWVPICNFGSGMHFLAKNRRWAKKGSGFIKIPLVL